MKKTILIILSVFLLCTYIMSGTTTLVFAKNTDDFLKNQNKANLYYQKILDSFAFENDEIEYPDYYGGSYLDSCGNLVVLLTEDTLQNRNEICNAAGTKTLSFIPAESSYKHIYDTYKSLTNLLQEEAFKETSQIKDITELYIDEVENSLIVVYENSNEEALNYLTKNAPFPEVLRFKKGKPVHADSSISPGAQITINDGYYSAGFRCMYQGSPAIISAGHGVVNGESCQIGNQNGSSLGTVTRQQCSGSVDACIITLASGVSATSITNHGVSIAGNSCITSIATNSLVYKDGYAGGVTYGNVISSSSSCYYNGVWISGLIKSDYYSTNGDSGGLVYTLYNGVFVPVGIHVASYINSFCCPAHTIVDNFGVTMY